jgi:hypothetical protein
MPIGVIPPAEFELAYHRQRGQSDHGGLTHSPRGVWFWANSRPRFDRR